MTLLVAFLLAQAPAAEALSQRALTHARQGQIAQAETLWKQALQADPMLFSANFNLGFTYFQKEDSGQAEPYLARAAKARPRDFNARYLHGAVLSKLGRNTDALRAWRAALEIDPGHPKLLHLVAVEYSKGQYFQDAARAAAAALEKNSADPNLFLLAIKAHQDVGNRTAALAIAERFTGTFPESGRAQFEYGYELFRAGRRAEALPYILKAQSDPAYEEPFYFLGELYLKEGRAQDAIAPLRRAIAIRKDYIAAWSALARALLQLGRPQDALQELKTAVAIAPNHPQPHLLLSQVYYRLGDEGRAAEEKAVSLKLRRLDAHALEPAPGRPFPQPKQKRFSFLCK